MGIVDRPDAIIGLILALENTGGWACTIVEPDLRVVVDAHRIIGLEIPDMPGNGACDIGVGVDRLGVLPGRVLKVEHRPGGERGEIETASRGWHIAGYAASGAERRCLRPHGDI